MKLNKNEEWQQIFEEAWRSLGHQAAAQAFFQWGVSAEFYWVVAVYLVIQILDGMKVEQRTT